MTGVLDGEAGARMGRWMALAFTVFENFVIFRVSSVTQFAEAGVECFFGFLSPSCESSERG